MDRIAHPFEVRLAEQLGHGRNGNGCRLWYKHRMAAFFVRAGIVGVMRSVVMQEGCFPTNWACGDGCIDVKSQRIEYWKSVENKGFLGVGTCQRAGSGSRIFSFYG